MRRAVLGFGLTIACLLGAALPALAEKNAKQGTPAKKSAVTKRQGVKKKQAGAEKSTPAVPATPPPQAVSPEDDRAALNALFREPPETDTDGDGKIDTWTTYYPNNEIKEKRRDTNKDGKVDLVETFRYGSQIEKREQDMNFDGKMDRWEHWVQKPPLLTETKADLNFDGKVDEVIKVMMAQVKNQKKIQYHVSADRDFNGSFEKKFVSDQPIPAN